MSAEPQPTSPLIEFHTGGPQRFPAPFPASRGIPEWFKNLQAGIDTPDENIPTLKRCPPFLEALSCGYLIPLAGDVIFTTDARGNLTFQATGPVVETHDPIPYQTTPFAAAVLVKFMNPWIIKTPPGYSTLLIPAINRFHIPFLVLGGLVETDTYYREIHFPAICQPHA